MAVPKVVKAVVNGALQCLPRRLQEVLHQLLRPPLECLPDAPDLFHSYRYLSQCLDLTRQPGGWIYQGQFYPDYLTIGGAGHAIFDVAMRYCQGKGVDVGAGLWPLPGSTPVDLERGLGRGKSISDFADESLDYIFSSHCLEHIEDWRPALDLWVKKLRPGGTLFLYLPHPDCAIWHPGAPFVGDGHKWIPTPEVISAALSKLDCKILERDDGPDAMFSFYICASKRS